jgi:DNA-binding transcriptional MocR family regulator
VEEFPWHDWARIISARVFRERPAAALAYGDPQGLPELRSAIGDYLGAARGIVCDEGTSAAPLSSYYATSPRSRGFVLGLANTTGADAVLSAQRVAHCASSQSHGMVRRTLAARPQRTSSATV